MARIKTYIRLSILFFSALFFFSAASFGKSDYKVLILNSYHPNFQWSDALIDGIKIGLHGTVADEDIFIEHMDGRRFADDSLYSAQINQLLQYKYRNWTPDIIISNDDFAFEFLKKNVPDLFSGIPVIFTGLNILPDKTNVNFPYSGVIEGMDVEGNLRLIFKLFPHLDRLVVIGGGTELDKQHLNYLRDLKQNFVSRELIDSVEFNFWVNYSQDELFEKASKLSSGTAVLFMSMQKFRDGAYFSYSDHLKELSSICPVPIFGMYGAITVGNGLLGGRLNKPVEQGTDAGRMVIEVLQGKPIDDVPILDKPSYEYRFDYRQMKRFGLSKNDLPPNSVIDFTPENFFYENRFMLGGSLLVIVSLLAVIFFLTMNVRKRRKAEHDLKRFNESLEKTILERTAELEASQSSLKQSNNDKVKFFSILAHDLRAPFNAIMGFSHILGVDNEELTLQEAKEYGQSIYDSSQSMFRLLENLLEWSRVMNKTKVASPVHFPLRTIVEQNLALLSNNAVSKNISLEKDGDLDAIVYADFNMMNSVLQNLMSNAIKFTRKDGTIKVSVYAFPENKYVDMLIEDDGVGMSDEIRQNLFKIDKTQSTPGTANEKGSGLGLMLCKEFVEMNRGDIEVRSELGKGTTITIRLLKDE